MDCAQDSDFDCQIQVQREAAGVQGVAPPGKTRLFAILCAYRAFALHSCTIRATNLLKEGDHDRFTMAGGSDMFHDDAQRD